MKAHTAHHTACSLEQTRGLNAVLVEASGLADPAPIARMLLDRVISQGRFRYGGVVAVVDAQHARRHLGDPGTTLVECARQVAIADVVVVNKVRLVG